MAQAMQGAKRFGQPGFFFYPLEHIRNIASWLVVIPTGENVGASGLWQSGQNSPCLLLLGEQAPLLLNFLIVSAQTVNAGEAKLIAGL